MHSRLLSAFCLSQSFNNKPDTAKFRLHVDLHNTSSTSNLKTKSAVQTQCLTSDPYSLHPKGPRGRTDEPRASDPGCVRDGPGASDERTLCLGQDQGAEPGATGGVVSAEGAGGPEEPAAP